MLQVSIQGQPANHIQGFIKIGIEYQLRIISFGISKTKRKLDFLEKEAGMDSRNFYRQFMEGRLGDDLKFIKWAGEYETLEQLEEDQRELQEYNNCL
jgi:hypothetical protein